MRHLRIPGFLAALLVAAAGCDPPSKPHPVPATRLPSTQEIAGHYEDRPTGQSLKRSLILREDGTFTYTTVDQEQVTRVVSGLWAARQVPETGTFELRVIPFFMPDGKRPVDSLSMPIQTNDGILCFTHSEAGAFVRLP